jgi:hypothetical protein
MKVDDQGDGRSRRALGALLKIREIEDQGVRLSLHQKQAEIARVEEEMAVLRKRRESVIRRGGGEVLRERRLLDEIARLSLRKARELEALRREAEGLIEAYLATRKNKDAVKLVHDRLEAKAEVESERRADQASCDLAASRINRTTRDDGEARWEE